MKKYTKNNFKTLLKAIDANLIKEVEIILIGGAAALLAYKATRITHDIDSFNNINALKDAYTQAKKDTRLDIPVSQAGIADAPYNFEDRLITYNDIKLNMLIVKIPEIHDFILMKTIRGYECTATIIFPHVLPHVIMLPACLMKNVTNRHGNDTPLRRDTASVAGGNAHR